jgi:hypothetical protein
MANVLTWTQHLDKVTSAHALRDRLAPGRVDTFVEAVSDIRKAYEEARTISNVRSSMGMNDSKLWMRVASIPHGVVAALEAVEPGIMTNKKKFYRWLRAHPEWQTVKYQSACIG